MYLSFDEITFEVLHLHLKITNLKRRKAAIAPRIKKKRQPKTS